MAARQDDDGDLSSARLSLLGRWAAELARGRRVLDASARLGPGTKEMLATARALVAVTPRAAIGEALRGSIGPAAEVQCSDLTRLPFETNSFDAVISLETNAHHLPLGELVGEFHRVLDEREGFLAVSFTEDVGRPRSEGVDPSLEPSALSELLSCHFAHVRIVHQISTLEARFICDGDSMKVGTDTAKAVVSAADASQPEGAIFVASRSPLGEQLAASVSLPVRLSQWERELALLGNLAVKYEASSELTREIADDRIRLLRELFLTEQMVERELIGDHESLVETTEPSQISLDLTNQLESARRQLAEAQELVDALQSTVSWRVTRPLRSVRRRIG